MDGTDQGESYRSVPSQTSSWHLFPIAPLAPSKRPLSDIKELTEPNLADCILQQPANDITHRRRASRTSIRSNHVPTSAAVPKRPPSAQSRKSAGSSERCQRDARQSIPLSSVPPRSTSRQPARPQTPLDGVYELRRPSSANLVRTIRNRGHSISPVKDALAGLEGNDNVSNSRLPTKTILEHDESPYTHDLLDHPMYRHPRLTVDIRLSAPLFVGGGSVEGKVQIQVDEADRTRHRKSLTISMVSIDLLGVEELSNSKRSIFLALGNELLDRTHPPPLQMVYSLQPVTRSDLSWILVPSTTSLPFLIQLPLRVGPPPFLSKHAWIKYILFATVRIKDAGKEWIVRSFQDTAILSVHDPEKALMSLRSPLTASDRITLSKSKPLECINATAGLHRQTWVSGTSIFVDVHIANHTRRGVKRLDLQLQRDILCYDHAPAATLEISASQARLYDRNERSIISHKILKRSSGSWSGVSAASADLRTFELELPRNEASVACNKFFEVRYYLNIIIIGPSRKTISLQLPVQLIHMNSLDVPQNSIVQVAAAIEKHSQRPKAITSRKPPSVTRKASKALSGRAFSAPRRQSLDRAREHENALEEIGHILEQSPRQMKVVSKQQQENGSPLIKAFDENPGQVSGKLVGFNTAPSKRHGRVIPEEDAAEIRHQLKQVQARASENGEAKAVLGPNGSLDGAYDVNRPTSTRPSSPHLMHKKSSTFRASNTTRPSSSLSQLRWRYFGTTNDAGLSQV